MIGESAWRLAGNAAFRETNHKRRCVTKKRLDGMILLLLGAALFLLHGSALEVASPFSMLDFKAVYYGARCLVQHGDPYKAIEVLRVYRADAVKLPADPKRDFLFKQVASECINPPTTLFFLTPMAVLPDRKSTR